MTRQGWLVWVISKVRGEYSKFRLTWRRKSVNEKWLEDMLFVEFREDCWQAERRRTWRVTHRRGPQREGTPGSRRCPRQPSLYRRAWTGRLPMSETPLKHNLAWSFCKLTDPDTIFQLHTSIKFLPALRIESFFSPDLVQFFSRSVDQTSSKSALSRSGKIRESNSWYFNLSRFPNLIWNLEGNIKGLLVFLAFVCFHSRSGPHLDRTGGVPKLEETVQIWVKTGVSMEVKRFVENIFLRIICWDLSPV